MKLKLTLCISIYLLATTMHAQHFQWARGVGGSGSEQGRSVSVDDIGNVYVTGFFDSPTITFGNTVLTNTGSYDIFLVKYDSAGNVLWATTAPGTSYNYAYGVTTDCGPGHVIITGYFGGSITFGSTTLINTSNGADIFVAQYDASGNLMWAKSAGGAESDYVYSITTDYACNIYITGYFNSPTLAFGSTTLTNTTATMNNIFLAKYDTSGNVLWVRSAGGPNSLDDRSNYVTHNNNGVYITGHYNNTITFGPITLSSVGGNDGFLVNYDLNGNVVWARSLGGTLDDNGVAIASNSNAKDVYVTGNFNSPVCSVGSLSLTNASPGPSFYYDDVFIVRYDSVGNVIWANSAGGDEQDRAGGITMDLSQNVYATGVFRDTIAFGNTTLLSQGGNTEIYVTKCDSAGNELWSHRAGGSGEDYAHGIDVYYPDSLLYITGKYDSDPCNFSAINLSNAGSSDFLLTQMNDLFSSTPEVRFDIAPAIYPNPSSGVFILAETYTSGTIRVYNIIGDLVYSSAVNSAGQNVIDLSDQPSGSYVIVVLSEGNFEAGKIFIDRY